jgi:hypothetical protein
MSADMSTEAISRYPCPVCGRGRGKECISPSGKWLARPHSQRLDLVAPAQRKPWQFQKAAK